MGIAFLEALLKWLSRTTSGGPPFPFTWGDADWWMEWIVASTVALVIFQVTNAHEGKPVSTKQAVTAAIALVLGYGALPKLANIFALDSEGNVVSVRWLAVLNIISALMLMATVAVGVKIYG